MTTDQPSLSARVEFDDALCEAFKAVGVAAQQGTNPHLKTSYATMRDIDQACREALVDNGFSFPQFPSSEFVDGKWVVSVRTQLRRKGVAIESVLSMPVPKGDAQGIGSATTYARRYSLAAICGVVSDDASDDDGHAASRQPQRAEQHLLDQLHDVSARVADRLFDGDLGAAEEAVVKKYGKRISSPVTNTQARGLIGAAEALMNE